MSLCVNTNSKIFKDTAKRLNISENSLENILHEYMNTEGNVNAFPSDSYILSKIQGEPLTDISEKAQLLIEKKYSKPFIVDSYADAQAIVADISQYFDPKHVGVKETYDGKYEVSLAKVVADGKTKIATPIKEQYKGKLIFAQSGTGKTSIADNVNVIDADYLLGNILGVPTAAAGAAFKLLNFSQKAEIGQKYRDAIRQKISEGKTVVTANLSMLRDADVIIYNESAKLTTERTSAEDRGNRWTDEAYQNESLTRISEHLQENPNKEVHKLNKDTFLGDVLLTDRNFNIFTERVTNNSLNELLNEFVNNFGIKIEEYRGEMPVFDALNRIISARSAEELPNSVGEAVAFMMQYNPDVKAYIAERAVQDGKVAREEIFTKNGNVTNKYHTEPFVEIKSSYFKEIGDEIAKELRRQYNAENNVEIKVPLIKKIWNAIVEFINRLLGNKEELEALAYAQQRLNGYIRNTARNILANNEGLITASLTKPGSEAEGLVRPVNVIEALDNNPYENNVILAMTSEGISLAGSTSIAMKQVVMRPPENPFHDLDFAAPNRTKEELESALAKHFGNFAETNTIPVKDSDEIATRSYLILSEPFYMDNNGPLSSITRIISRETGEILGTLNSKKTEFIPSKEGVNGKVLDFFVTPQTYAPIPYNYKGKTYLINDPREALLAKTQWMRIKDIFDINRAVPYDFQKGTLPESLKERAAFNIDGKSLKEFLRDKGLIHTYDPSIGDADIKSMYVTKGDGTYSIRSLVNEIYTVLRINGIPADAISFEKTKAGNAMRVVFNESTDAIARMTEKNRVNVSKVVDFLQARIPALRGRVKYATIDEAKEALGRELASNENSFIKDGQIYLIGRRFNEDIAIEECLHPFTATLKYDNPFLYNRLAYEAKELFPKLWTEIVANYDKGFTNEDRINELVTQALARTFREEFNTTKEESRKTFMNYIKDFISWFKNLFYRVNPVTGNQIIDLETLNPNMTFRDLAGLINTSDTEFSVGFEEKTRFNKERANINPEDAEFITENIVIPRVPTEAIKKIKPLWDNVVNSTADSVTIPYAEWKSLNVSAPVYENGVIAKSRNNQDIIESSTDSLERLFTQEYSGTFTYNKATKSITIPAAAYNLARAIKEAEPMREQIFEVLAQKGYNPEAHLFSLIDAIDILAYNERISFDEILTDVGGEYYYSDSRQGELFDEYGNPTEAALTEEGLSRPEAPKMRQSLSNFQDKTAKMITQLNNLLDSDLMSNSEVRHVAEQAVYFISDAITEFLETPSKVFDVFPDLAKKEGKDVTEEEKQSEMQKISQMSRADLARYITPERLIEYTKMRLFSPQGNNNINTRTLMKKAQLITENFDAIIRFANDAFSVVEDFAITSMGDKLSIEENMAPTVEDFENNNDADAVLENEGSLQEHWQIESRTLDVLSSMSKLVKQVLNRCFQIRVNPETGVEEKVLSEFGIAERVNAKDATSSILRWTRGAESLSHMLSLLKAKAVENPWIKQITDKLEDASGKEADFQSQFYGVFAKAFQPYSIVLKERDDKTGEMVYKSIQVNQHPALTDAYQSIEVAYKTGNHVLFNNSGIRKDTLETLTSITNSLIEKAQHSLEENDRAELVDLFTKATAALGYVTDETTVNLALDSTNTFHTMVNKLKAIVDNLNNAIGKEDYNPFKYGAENSISGYLKDFLKPLTDRLEDTAVSSFYDSGKMYQSFVTPSYLTVMMNHFTSEDATFKEWLNTEYGAYEWFRNADGSWRNVWLETLDGLSQQDRKDLFKHKVQLNFNKHNYMRNMSDVEYGLSILSEYFSELGNAKGTTVPVWFRIPMMSNKPSSEFIRMYAYTGSSMEYRLTLGFNRIFQQELSRIQTVDIRDYSKKNPNFIKSFDSNGRKFMMLDFFNKYLEGGNEANSELGRLINKAIKEGTEKLTQDEQIRMNELVNAEIVSFMNAKADNIISQWKANGLFEGAKQIANIGKEDATVETKLREFIWNDTFASMNILELTITDPAFYKDAEDLQKRLAQIHAPGTRANVEATDYNGNSVTDGKFRTILLKDFDDFKSNIKDNLRIVFDRKLTELENSGVNKEDGRYKAAAATYENIISQFDAINVADAEGYSSPSSYRKKALIFGRWSKQAEEVYQKLKAGNYNYSDLQVAFQPLKPFVYGQISKPALTGERKTIATPLTNLKVPVQFKNSEYLLIMADAILQGEDTGRPNLLRAIYEVMEESAERTKEAGQANGRRGIDTIQFESTCKSGLMAAIDIKQFSNMKGGETAAKLALEQAIYNEDGTYNTDTYVYEVPFENYAIQQEVPEHFKNHFQAHGSQIRYIIPSDLESVDSEGNPVTYNYFDRGVEKKLTAEEYKQEYERNISENIEASISELAEQLGIGNDFLSKKDRNVALSEILLKEIFSSPRYGAELAAACTVNSETGEFNIPLGDPIQAKRIEQLINSIVKNRINKQEIAGGPVVQVSNFGTSRELNIRFNSKKGGLLMTKAEFAKTMPQNGKSYDVDAAYRKYVEENQAGIAYFEVFAPIYANELFEKFADKDGNIDIETIEMINPDLLKMIGYRIPTEDKYSMAPLKIVGFLPREAGDGIMLPNDITLLTGSDFDVDKFYLMRKEINIAMRIDTPNSVTDSNFEQAANEFAQRHSDEVRKYLRTQIDVNELTLDARELREVNRRADEYVSLAIDAENKRHEARLEQIEEDATDALIAFDERESNDDLMEGQEEKAERKVEKGKDKQIAAENKYHERNLAKQQTRRNNFYAEEVEKAKLRKANNLVNQFLAGDKFAKAGDEITQRLKRAYVNYMFDYSEETEGTTYRNNKVVDMSWAVLTNETTASKMLTPGGFEPQKRMGYLISAYQNPAVNMTWEQLNAIQDIDALKSLCYTNKNLCFIDTHLQFYKQNSAAATALGMAAVQKVGHAVLESNGFRIDVSGALGFENNEFFSIAGKEFSGIMEIDNKYNDEGQLIGRTLGEFVAMFADAVKDPVANLMNINSTTMPIVTALIRFGMPFENVALFISQPAIRRALDLYNSENVTNFVTLSNIIEKEIKEFEQSEGIDRNSVLKELNTITKEELIEGLRESKNSGVIDYKVLKFFQYADMLAKQLKSPTYATRFNSISNAVGPLVIDNLIKEYKAEEGTFDYFYDKNGKPANFNTVLEAHPILKSFYATLNVSRELLDEMPANSLSFRRMLASADKDVKRTLYSDKKTLGELSDFYQSYLLIASGAIPIEATKENKHQGLKYYIEQFPQDFVRAKAKELFKGNPLIDAIKLDIQKGRAVLRVDTTGLTTQDKERLGDGWADLYRSGERGRKLAEHLFYYNFWRTGIGFSPKSFMGLFPTRLKSKIKGYNEAFTVSSDRFAANVDGRLVLEQFIRSNADNNKLVPRIKFSGDDALHPEIGKNTATNRTTYQFSGDNYYSIKNKPYVKVKIGGKDVLLGRTINNDVAGYAIYEELTLLGNNGEYYEASIRPDYTPLANTAQVKEQNNEGQVTEVTSTQTQSDDVPLTESPNLDMQVKRATKFKDLILRMFMMNGRTQEQAEQKMAEYQAKSDAEKQSLAKPMKEFIRRKFEQLGITYNEELVDDVYNELC